MAAACRPAPPACAKPRGHQRGRRANKSPRGRERATRASDTLVERAYCCRGVSVSEGGGADWSCGTVGSGVVVESGWPPESCCGIDCGCCGIDDESWLFFIAILNSALVR